MDKKMNKDSPVAFLGCMCQPRTQLQKHWIPYVSVCLFSILLQRQDRAKANKDEHSGSGAGGKNRPWPSRWLLLRVVSSRKLQRLLRFVPPCWLFILDNFIPFVSVLSRWREKRKKEKDTETWIPGLKEGNPSPAWSRWRYLQSIRLWSFSFLSLLPHPCCMDDVRHIQAPPPPFFLRWTSPLTQICLASLTPSATESRSSGFVGSMFAEPPSRASSIHVCGRWQRVVGEQSLHPLIDGAGTGRSRRQEVYYLHEESWTESVAAAAAAASHGLTSGDFVFGFWLTFAPWKATFSHVMVHFLYVHLMSFYQLIGIDDYHFG